MCFPDGSCFPLFCGLGYIHLSSCCNAMSSGTMIGHLGNSNIHCLQSTAFGRSCKKQSTRGRLLWLILVKGEFTSLLVQLALSACRDTRQLFLRFPPFFPASSFAGSSNKDFVAFPFPAFCAMYCKWPFSILSFSATQRLCLHTPLYLYDGQPHEI